jgi:hypothetical protein
MYGNEVGCLNCRVIKPIDSEIEASDVRASAPQPSGRRRQAKGLATELVGGDEENVHGS